MLITRLKLDNVGVGKSFELWISIEALLRVLVESLQVSNLWRGGQEIGEADVKLTNEHAELSAPVTNVVYAHHIVALELEDAANAITLNGRAQVTNVHVLSDVRR